MTVRASSDLFRPGVPDDLETLVAIDDDACGIFAGVGIDLSFGAENPLVQAERAAWAAALAAGNVWLALAANSGAPVGFVAMGWKDGLAYVQQVSVRATAMRRGIGRALMDWGDGWALGHGAPALVLTTYAHVAWNRPFYASLGWAVLSEADWGRDIRAEVAFQRAHLPDAAQRLVMTKRL